MSGIPYPRPQDLETAVWGIPDGAVAGTMDRQRRLKAVFRTALILVVP
jgi:hypothetical protein